MLFEKDNKSDPELIGRLIDDPDLFADIFTKGNNDPKILKKIVEKGKDLNTDVIKKLYGKVPPPTEKNI